MKVYVTAYIGGCFLLSAADGSGRDELFQVDYDFPGLASGLGWTPAQVQHGGAHTHVTIGPGCSCSAGESGCAHAEWCAQGLPDPCEDDACTLAERCDHDDTDGTVDCRQCGATAGAFIASAVDWLSVNEGEEFDDPGYFESEEA